VPGAQAEFVGTLFFLFFTIVTVVYRTDFAGGIVKPARADAATTDFVDLVGTVGSATQLMIAASFGCARLCAGVPVMKRHADTERIASASAFASAQHDDQCVCSQRSAASARAACLR
jgi:hypothetical protein